MAWLAASVATSCVAGTADASAGRAAWSAPTIRSRPARWRSPSRAPPTTGSVNRPHDQHDANDNGHHDDHVDQQPEGVSLAAQRIEHEPRVAYSTYTAVYTMTHMMSTKCQ